MIKVADTTMLDKVDIIRNRFPISYKEAYDLLEQNGGNVVRALIAIEDRQNHPGVIEKVEERITVMGHELVHKLQEIVRTGQHAHIRVLRGGRQVLSLPAAVGAVSAFIFPYLTVFATVAALTQKYEVVLDKRGIRKQQPDHLEHQPGVVNVHHEQVEQAIPV